VDSAALLVSLGLGAGVLLVAEGFLRAPPVLDGIRPRRRQLGILVKVRALLWEAGHPRVDPLVFLLTGVLVALGVGITVAFLIPIPILSVLASMGMVSGTLGYVTKQRDARYQRLQQAWPGLIDHVRAGIRSGSDVTMAVIALPDSLPPDIVKPVAEFRADIRRGMDTDTALGELSQRFANPVGDRICEVLRMAHEVGGTDLPGVLLQLQHSVRADIAVRQDAQAAQSWIRSTALLALAAPWIVLVVIGTREQTVAAYQTLEGTLILMVGALVSVVAYRMMRSLGELPPATRWLA